MDDKAMENPVFHLLSNIPKNRVFGKEPQLIIERGRSLFKNTSLVEENIDFSKEDTKRVVAFWMEISPSKKECETTGNNWWKAGGSLQHFIITSQVDRYLTEKICENHPELITQISPTQMEIVGLLHDLGRSKTHQFYLTDSLTELLMEEIGISPKIRRCLHKIDWYWEIDKPLELETISLAQFISVLADTLGKISSHQRRLRRPNELIESTKKSKEKYLKLLIETDLDRLVRERIKEYSRREELVLTYAVNYIRDLGVNIEEILETLDWMVNFSAEDLFNYLVENKIIPC